ncbi:hypothetical protein [Aquimarina sediminis]|uniref:hypothetical protein n=1 Tax=Aquimarina sediminis TaxID=2070536 RepID=UPI000CA08D98|nr:hypothetical protein [Aquimarina sediminis]
MFRLGRKQLDIKEKNKTSVETENARLKDATNPNNGTLRFSAIELHIAIARCILSRDLTNLDLVFESISSFFRYQTIINTAKMNLTLNKSNFELLRDFSKKTRIGELAQGITYLLAQEHLNFPIVVDFEGFVKYKNSNASINGKTPDFILQKATDFNYSLIESKGHYVSTSGSTKGKLNKALQQCDSGEQILNTEIPKYSLNKSFGVCLKLFNEQDSNKSEIQFVDPTRNSRNDNFNIEIIRYHYASWFLLMGNMQIYEKLLGQKDLDEKDLRETNIKEINGTKYYMFDIFSSRFFFQFDFLFHMHYRREFRNYGIREDIVRLLMGKSKELPKMNDYESKNNENKKFEIFNDGTIINGTQQFV